MSYTSTHPTHAAHAVRRDRHVTARFDVILIGTVVLVAAIGLVILYSATRSQLILNGGSPYYWVERQAMFVVIGVVVMVAVALFDYRRLEHVSTIIYVGTVLALLGVYVVGSSANGSQRWYPLGVFQLQPSEFATLSLIVVIATYCSRRPEGLEFRDLVRLVILAGVPILLVVKQPDLGTSIVLTVIMLVMLAVAGMPVRYLVLLVVGAAIVVAVAFNVGLVPSYQLQRLTTFISPPPAGCNLAIANSACGVANNVNQAKNAIGAGGFFGAGLFRGAQTNLAYVPSQTTDFIFSAVGEQVGFVGSATLLLLYGVVAWRIVRTAQQARDTLGRLLCSGVLALLIFSVFENVGMNVGIMPVAGIPLPFLSYGGSAAIVFFAAIGLTISVHMRSVR